MEISILFFHSLWYNNKDKEERRLCMSIFEIFKKLEESSAPRTPVGYVVCCLGNPTSKYEGTRHNAGFMVADVLAEKLGAKVDKMKFSGLIGEADTKAGRIAILKPQTYMNESGISARAALDWYKLTPDKLIVVCDDLELVPGRLRVRPKGSEGGHNGLKSIAAHVGTKEFPRVRVGIGRPSTPEYQVIDWVLGRFSADEAPKIKEAVALAADAVLDIVSVGVEPAMNKYNGHK